MVPDQAAARTALGLSQQRRVVGILPGSRIAELKYNSASFLGAARLLAQRDPQLQFVVPMAGDKQRACFMQLLQQAGVADLDIQVIDGQSHRVMEASDAVLVASGTASLEVALYKKPMVIAYKMMCASYQIMRHMNYQPWIGLPNILAREFLVAGVGATGGNAASVGGCLVAANGRSGTSGSACDSASSICITHSCAIPQMQVRKRFAQCSKDTPAEPVPGDNTMVNMAADLSFNLFDYDGEVICGVDEAGRGPLAGPVFAAAVILDPQRPIAGLRDSKKLSEARRDHLALEIKEHALAWAVAQCSEEEIDSLNILHASMLAMRRAVEALQVVPTLALIDGNRCPVMTIRSEAIIKGDDKVAAISAASIPGQDRARCGTGRFAYAVSALRV